MIFTLPVHNEETTLASTVAIVHEYLMAKCPIDFTILIAEDGSTDRTKDIARDLQRRFSHVEVITEPKTLGRGLALRQAWAQYSDGDFYAFIDADMAVPIKYFSRLLHGVLEEGYDCVIGSRYVKGSVVERPRLRQMVSKAYNSLLGFFYASDAKDHQCGFRIFSKAMTGAILRHCTSDSWFLDTECLVMFQRRFKVKEIPVEWNEHRTRKTDLRRLFKDFKRHGVGLFNLGRYMLRVDPLFMFGSDLMKKLLKFSVVGFGSFVFVLFWTFIFSLFTSDQVILAIVNSVAFFVAMTFQFKLNKKWTFHDKSKKVKKQFSFDVTLRLVGWAIYELVYLFLASFGMGYIFSTIGGAAVSVLFNFVCNRYIVFSRRI
ncbi:MAG: glycosyltransferase [Candidatus Lokiarchaeota archaeon]|nr:glycosyltransferase [Candidatus Lokiarchaeota archaeon]